MRGPTARVSDPRVLHVRDGDVVFEDSWVYVWILESGDDGSDGSRVVYIGTTGLDPALRTWLHIHDKDPGTGRVASHYPAAGGSITDPLDVYAFAVPSELERREVKQMLVNVLSEAGLLAGTYFGVPPMDDVASSEVASFCREVTDSISRILRHL